MNFAYVYTDGSCHTQLCIGAWAAIILVNDSKIVLSGTEHKTTHNRMEILGVINSIKHVCENYKNIESIKIVSDSQYVVGLVNRQVNFLKNQFKTKAGNDIRNIDLVKELLNLLNNVPIEFVKIKAHQKPTNNSVNYNIEADKLSRKLVRDQVNFKNSF